MKTMSREHFGSGFCRILSCYFGHAHLSSVDFQHCHAQRSDTKFRRFWKVCDRIDIFMDEQSIDKWYKHVRGKSSVMGKMRSEMHTHTLTHSAQYNVS